MAYGITSSDFEPLLYSTLLLHVLPLVCLDLKGALSFDLGEALRGGPLPFHWLDHQQLYRWAQSQHQNIATVPRNTGIRSSHVSPSSQKRERWWVMRQGVWVFGGLALPLVFFPLLCQVVGNLQEAQQGGLQCGKSKQINANLVILQYLGSPFTWDKVF